MKIFVDTSAFIAYLIVQEKYHNVVVKKFESYINQRALFFTSDYILDELYTRLNYDHGHRAVSLAMEHIDLAVREGDLRMLTVDNGIISQAKKIILKYKEHKLSFTDATSVALISKFNLDAILSLDSDFKRVRVAVV